MLGLCHFIFITFTNEKFFTVTLNVTVTRVPRTFLELGKNKKNIFLNIKTSTIKSEKNIYQTIHSTSFIFIFFGIFTIFLYFSRFFENLNSIFWKNYNFVLSFLHTAICNIWVNWYFSTHLWYTRVCGKIKIHPNIASGGVQERQNKNIPWIKWNHTVSHYANGPGWPLWQALKPIESK